MQAPRYIPGALSFAAPVAKDEKRRRRRAKNDDKPPWMAATGIRGEATQGGTGRPDRRGRVLPKEPSPRHRSRYPANRQAALDVSGSRGGRRSTAQLGPPQRCTRTGMFECERIFDANVPNNTLINPGLPWVDMNMRSQFSSFAAFRMPSVGDSPARDTFSHLTPLSAHIFCVLYGPLRDLSRGSPERQIGFVDLFVDLQDLLDGIFLRHANRSNFGAEGFGEQDPVTGTVPAFPQPVRRQQDVGIHNPSPFFSWAASQEK